MKTKFWLLITIVAISGLVSSLFSQDIIVLKTGDELQAIVSEVNLDVIKYKKFDNPTGPVYNIEKSQVFMIKYENGSKDIFNETIETKAPENTITTAPPPSPAPVSTSVVIPNQAPTVTKPYVPPFLSSRRGNVYEGNQTLSESAVKNYMSQNPEALSLYTSGKSLNLIGEIFDWSSYGFILLTYLQYKAGTPNYILGLGGFIGFSLTGMILKGVGNGKINNAVKSHNSKIISGTSLNLNINNNGVGIALRF